jgi:hypothetical protein
MTKQRGGKFSEALKINSKNGKFSLKGSLDASNDVTFYRLNFLNRSSCNISLDRLPGNVELTLFNSKKKAIAVSNEQDGKPEFIREQVNAGVYFLKVRRIAGNVKYRAKTSIVELAGNTFTQALNVTSTKSDRVSGKFSYSGVLGGKDQARSREAFYQFNLTERSTFLGLLEGLKANADIELYDSNRQLITGSFGTGVTSELVSQVLEAGTYFLKIKVKSGSTKYKLKLNLNSFTTDLTNISDSTRLIALGARQSFSETYRGSIALDNFYKVDLDAPSNLNLVLDGLSADANLQLLSREGTVLASSSNTGTAQDILSLNLKAGTYFVRVLPGQGGLPTSYTLDATLGALKLFGLTDNNKVVAFNPDKPNEAVDLEVSGLTTGETLKSIDFRPATGELYGVSSASRLYTIDLKTGKAIPVGSALNPTVTGTTTGLDFNPTVDRLRLVTDADANLRLVPTTGALAATDTALVYAATDRNTGRDPNVTAVAYTSNFANALTTTLYGIDTTLDVLVRQGDVNGSPTSPNAGTLSTIGALGVDFAAGTGFDILTDSSLTNTAYALSGTTLYSIDLSTGRATSLGSVNLGDAPSDTIATTAMTTSTATGTTTAPTPTVPTSFNFIGLAGRV